MGKKSERIRTIDCPLSKNEFLEVPDLKNSAPSAQFSGEDEQRNFYDHGILSTSATGRANFNFRLVDSAVKPYFM